MKNMSDLKSQIILSPDDMEYMIKTMLECNIPTHNTSWSELLNIAQAMELHRLKAKEYHLNEVKKFDIGWVSEQSELYCSCGRAHTMHDIDNNCCDSCEMRIFP